MCRKGRSAGSARLGSAPLGRGGSGSVWAYSPPPPPPPPPILIPGLSGSSGGRWISLPDVMSASPRKPGLVVASSIPRDIHPTASRAPATEAPTMTAAPPVHRFLLKTESQSIPLCYDLHGSLSLKLYHLPSSELYVNGQLDLLESGGFRMIVIHFKTDHHVEVYPSGVSVTLGQTVTHHTGQDPITAGSMTVVRRDKETEITAGDVRIVILLHHKDGEEFLWPVIRQRPSASDTEGILALDPAVYEEKQGDSGTKLVFKGQEYDAKRTTAADYSVTVPVTIDCWLMSTESVLQKRLDDFLVQRL